MKTKRRTRMVLIKYLESIYQYVFHKMLLHSTNFNRACISQGGGQEILKLNTVYSLKAFCMVKNNFFKVYLKDATHGYFNMPV